MTRKYTSPNIPEINKQLIKAASCGDVEALKGIKKREDFDWGEALCSAATTGNSECVSFILNHIEITDTARNSALIRSCGHGHISCMMELVNSHCSTKARNLALGNAAWRGHADYVKAILPFCDKSFGGFWPAEMAAISGHEDCLTLLLPDDPDTILSDQTLPLTVSAGHLGCAALLLDMTDCSAKAIEGALCNAISEGHEETTNRLLNEDRLRMQCKKTLNPIYESITVSNINALEALLPLFEGDITEASGDEMLRLATANKSADCLKLLMRETSASPTLAHVLNAVGFSSLACVEALAPIVNLNSESNGEAINFVRHPLVMACSMGATKAVEVLASYTSNTNVIDIALLNGICDPEIDRTASDAILRLLSRKTTHESLTASLTKARKTPEDYFINRFGMEGAFSRLGKAVEILRRSDVIFTDDYHSEKGKPARKNRCRAGAKL